MKKTFDHKQQLYGCYIYSIWSYLFIYILTICTCSRISHKYLVFRTEMCYSWSFHIIRRYPKSIRRLPKSKQCYTQMAAGLWPLNPSKATFPERILNWLCSYKPISWSIFVWLLLPLRNIWSRSRYIWD